MICHYCLSEISDDSSYCDQCGKKIMICPTCGKTAKGDYCLNDGTKLVHNSKEKQFSKNTFFKTARLLADKTKTTLKSIKLINKKIDAELIIDREAIIGREFGEFTDVFRIYSQVSAKHLLIKPTDNKQSWNVIDLNSSNGTKLNGEPLIPGNEYPLNRDDFLIIANIEFYIS